MNSKITFYYLHKTGTSEKIRYSLSMYKPNRSLMVQDDENSVLWILHGPDTSSETIRLAHYGIEEVNLMLKHKVVKIGHDEIEEILEKLIVFYKNSKDKEADTFLKSKIGADPAVKLKKVEKPKEILDSRTLKPMTTETNTESMKVSVAIESSQKPKQRKVKVTKPMSVSAIPAPPSTIRRETDEPDQFILKGDIQTGPIIDEFHIAYYEKSGGSNFVLVEELHESFESDHFVKLSDFVKLINKLKIEKNSRIQAKASLNAEYNKLIDTIF